MHLSLLPEIQVGQQHPAALVQALAGVTAKTPRQQERPPPADGAGCPHCDQLAFCVQDAAPSTLPLV